MDCLISRCVLSTPVLLMLFTTTTTCLRTPSLASSTSASSSTVVEEGNIILDEFYSRYQATKEVDLVFLLDRSGSVPPDGWASMLRFVAKVLEHFTVDKDNTRVGIVTFSTTARVDINDLECSELADLENKCTLFSRIRDKIEPKVPHGYTATHDAMQKAYNILLNSRPHAKKAVFILTDGKSNIGPPPVKIAFDILSLRWNLTWNSTKYGPQVEIYAFGIEDAYMPELRSMGSHLPHHVFLIPKFSLFAELAKGLHGGLQEESWLATEHAHTCGPTCNSSFAQCMCGSKIGLYSCVCQPGYDMVDGYCTACPLGYYKDNFRPESCMQCPGNTTTTTIAAVSEEDCHLLPGYRHCIPLPEILNGTKFQVTGTRQDEVLNTGLSCDDVKDGNSCHYECDTGFRLSGSPVMVCNHSGMWEGDIPTCNIIDCYNVEGTLGGIEGGDIVYKTNHTRYGALVDVVCHDGRVAIPSITTWSCDHHGRWTMPKNFECKEVWCSALDPRILPPYMSTVPPQCSAERQPHGMVCDLTCSDTEGFVLEGDVIKHCGYTNRVTWLPETWPRCKDIMPPVITCPENVEVTVAEFGHNATTFHFTSESQKPVVTDNSGYVNYTVLGLPDDNLFPVDHTILRYVAMDPEGNTANCTQNILVIRKTVEIRYCPDDIVVQGGRQVVTWRDPEFQGSDGTPLSHKCTNPNGSEFSGKHTQVVCYHEAHPGQQCKFTVTIQPVQCDMPNSPPPAKGALVCGEETVRDHLREVCRIMCEKGYSMADLTKQQFECGDDGQWHPSLGEWPSCSKTMWGRNTLIVQSMHVRYAGSCSEETAAITEAFQSTVQHLLNEGGSCQPPHTCKIEDITVMCGERRRKRNSGLFHSRSKRSVDMISIEYSLEVIREQDSFNASHPEMTHDDQEDLLIVLGNVVNGLDEAAAGGKVVFFVDGRQADATETVWISDMPDFRLDCSEGQVQIVNNLNPDEMNARCLTCAPGSYWEARECKLCPEDTYQPGEGQTQCLACPEGTATTQTGAWNISMCRDACPAGTSSSTGYEPCTPCDIGQYQPYPEQTFCPECPDNTTTGNTGTTNVNLCGSYCPVGHVSNTGVSPCIPCPPGTYQPQSGQTDCLPCDYSEENSYLEQWCHKLVSCSDRDIDCDHGFCVSSQINHTICVCDLGYHGDSCELNIDDCKNEPCSSIGGTCVDQVNGFTCDCHPAYTGKTCDVYVGPCSSNPCHHNGSCVDYSADQLECLCPDGFTGTFCEMEIDPCSSNPCAHGTCSSVDDNYFCNCDTGYAGTNCRKAVDHCAKVTCYYGGTCTSMTANFQCTCTHGFYGDQCEKAIDYCTPDPCYNNGRCINIPGSYYCACYSGYHGEQCLQAAEPSFDLMFPGSADSYVQLPLYEQLDSLSVCLWLRTNDKSHYGTLMSYSSESNWLNSAYRDVFTMYDYGSLEIIINGEAMSTQMTFNDGFWHHICVTWRGETGDLEIYINGTVSGSGHLAKETHVEPGGTLILGQRQLGSNKHYYDPYLAYIGEMSQVNIYSHVLEPSSVELLANQSLCTEGHGDILTWTQTLDGVKRGVKITDESLCLDVNECLDDNLCEEVEFCQDQLDGYQCVLCPFGGCPGKDHIPDACDSSPCNNGATCTPTPSSFRCTCPPAYTGATCSHLTSDCSLVKCHNNGTCLASPGGGVYCMCTAPWRGRYCDVLYEPTCLREPCLNGGTCSIGRHGQYSCKCPSDGRQYGPNCEVFNPCESKPGPCIDGATCVVLEAGNITCLCPPGYIGDSCFYVPGPTEPTDHCSNVVCKNDGVCKNSAKGFICECTADFSGMYCDSKRKAETRKYDVSVSLDYEYRADLKEDEGFKKQIKQEVHKIYSKNLKDDKLEVEITDIRAGSVVVDFSLYHTVYKDAVYPGPEKMKEVLYSELEENQFGAFKASLNNFKFNYKNPPQLVDWAMYLIISLIVLLVLAIIALGVYFGIRRRQAYTPKKLNNMPLCDMARVVNPAYIPDSSPPTPQMRNIQEDNVYADMSEPSPYAIDSRKDIDDHGKHFPSKRGREVNHDWVQRQSIPLPPKPDEPVPTSNGREDGGYLQPCKGNPPPSYRDVHLRDAQQRYGRQNLNVNSEYITPITAEEERYGLDSCEYLLPTCAVKNPYLKRALETNAYVKSETADTQKDNKEKEKNLHVYINTLDANKPTEAEFNAYLPLLPSTPPTAETTADKDNKNNERKSGENQPSDKTEVDPKKREKSPDYLRLKEPENETGNSEKLERETSPDEDQEVKASNPSGAPIPVIRNKLQQEDTSPVDSSAPDSQSIDSPPMEEPPPLPLHSPPSSPLRTLPVPPEILQEETSYNGPLERDADGYTKVLKKNKVQNQEQPVAGDKVATGDVNLDCSVPAAVD